MIINHNMNAMNAHRNMASNTSKAGRSMEKLSSGLRINRAGDDAAGLAISEKMRGQIRGLDQASRNAQDGISMIQTAEGALNESHSILQRMRELSVQASNGTATDTDRAALQDELNQLTSEINRIGNTTEFNTQKILNGGVGSGSGDKVTDATNAKLSFGIKNTAGTLGEVKIVVDGKTFDLTGFTVGTNKANNVDALKNITSGGVKLSELVDIKMSTAGTVTMEVKSSGSNSSIKFTGATTEVEKITAAATTLKNGNVGNNATVERLGLQATNKFSAVTINAGDNLTVKLSNGKEVKVELEAKAYTVDQAEDFVKDLNKALEKAGIGSDVTASLSNDGKLQLISENGKDVELTSTVTAFGGMTGANMSKNVEQVIGAGKSGSGFNTTLQIGANTGQSISLQLNDMRASALGITGNAGQDGFTSSNGVTNGTNDIKGEAALNISDKNDASKAITVIDDAIQNVSAERSKLGAVQNRLEHTINNLGTSSENLTAAESRIRDVDMAKEMLEFSKNNILNQASQSMLAQAKSQPEGVLQLLR